MPEPVPGSGTIGIVAGGGSLPREIAEAARARGLGVHVVALEGEAESDFGSFAVTRVGIGQLGAMVQALQKAKADRLVIVGRARRPDVLRLKTDLGFWLALPRIIGLMAAGGDDSVLKGVVGFFERRGLAVVGPADVAPGLVLGEGALGAALPNAAELDDIALGLETVGMLGPFDIGQGVVVADGRILAIEGAEGTDGMLSRVAALRAAPGASAGGVLVKRSKPGQDLRVDMPTIGPDTVTAAAAARLRGIAIEAGRVLAAGRGDLVRRADTAGIFVVGLAARAAPARGEGGNAFAHGLHCATRARPGRGARRDMEIGAALLGALNPIVTARAVAVIRRHVLAVEAGEGVAAAIRRAGTLRQWGGGFRRRQGVVVYAQAADLDAASLEAAAGAGLEGVALAGPLDAGIATAALVGQAEAQGLFLVSRIAGEAVA